MRILHRPRLFQFAIVVAATLFTAACGERKAAPVAADAAYVAPPEISLALSRFDIPLEYDFSPIMRIVEQVVPKTFGSIDSVKVVGTDSSKHYAYEARRGPFTAVADGPVVRLRTTLTYAARGWYKPRLAPTLSAGCGGDTDDERPRITVELVAPLTLSENWHLVSKAEISKLAPASTEDRDRCAVSIIRYDITDRVIDAARRGLTAQLPAINRKVGQVDITNQATGWWATLNRPIHLTDSVWLLLQPKQIRMGRLNGHGRTITVQTGLDATPKIITGTMPVDSAPPLPPLAHDSVGDGYHILLDGLIDYATASRGLTAAIGGKSFTQGGQTVRVRAVEMGATTKGRLMLTLRFVGDASGALQFIGTPQYDAAREVMMVPDLDYDLATNSTLVNAYAWLRSDALRTQMREMATVSVQPALDRGRSMLMKGLNRKLGTAATLSATVESVAVRGVYVIPAGLLVRAEARGQAGLFVRQQPKGRTKLAETSNDSTPANAPGSPSSK